METTSRLKVLRIPMVPSKESPIRLEEVSLINIDPQGSSKDEFKGFEKQLGHIPNIPAFDEPNIFSWNHRALWKESAGDEDFLMYLCLDEGAGLPHNKCLEGLYKYHKEGRYTAVLPFVVYGDAFVIKKSKADESKRTEYMDIGKGFKSLVDDPVSNDVRSLMLRFLMYSTDRVQR